MRSQTTDLLLAKQMDRKQFLKFTGTALIAVFGLSNLLALLRDSHARQTPDTASLSDQSHGFGSRKFGV